MEKPIHTHLTSYYLILRPLLWFSVGEKITYNKMSEYFTQKAIGSLLDFEFIVIKRP
jgi:hypothetical protein